MTTDLLSPHTLLTPKQEAYARYLFQGLSQRDAFLKAGYSSKQLPATIDVRACEMANSYKIKVRVAELQAKAESEAVGDVIERKKRLTDIYRANLVDFLDENGQVKLSKDIPHHSAVSEYSVTILGNDDGEVTTKRSLKLRDPVAAIQEQNKMERIGVQGDPTQEQGNRIINIFVGTGRAKELIDGLTKRLGEADAEPENH